MAKDRQVLVRLTDPQADALEKFADDRDYNNAEAARKILESRLTSEGYLNQELYGSGEDEQEETVADGGFETTLEWFEYQLIRWGERLAVGGILFAMASLIYAIAIELGIGPTEQFAWAMAAGIILGGGFVALSLFLVAIETVIIVLSGLPLAELERRFREIHGIKGEKA